MLTLEQIRIAEDAVVPLSLALTGLWYKNYQKSQAAIFEAKEKHIEEIAEQKAAVIQQALEEHKAEDQKEFEQQALAIRVLEAKIDTAEASRKLQHLENTANAEKMQVALDKIEEDNKDKIAALGRINANVEVLMKWFQEWLRSKT